MARLLTLKIGILNVKIHPHSPAQYVELLRYINKLRETVPVRGSEWGTLGYISEVKKSAGDKDAQAKVMFEQAIPILIRGAFYRYLNIDPKKPWFNLIDRRPLDTEAGEAPPPVPEHLKPNFREVPFVFYPRKHRLFFDLRHITTNLAQILMEALCKHVEITRKYGAVDIVIESSEETVQAILRIPTLTRLEILLTRPNPDDISRAAAEIQRRMDEQGLREWDQIMKSPKEEGIVPDETTKAAMELATSNGKVEAVGYEGDVRVVESTAKHPQVEVERYDPKLETYFSVMQRLAEGYLETLRSRKK